eukprot:TRINITY_DN4838_c0_g1_i2.p1 TRINITY_DN4838_c0_g1~~TRINITY_DN4838_c0_g1_i2.p1  ORF type:complete len:116 (-),score=15.47 TRINITY_DN4838_c0_g1_i2:254-601(-)
MAGVQLWMVVLGVSIICHASYCLVIEKRALEASLAQLDDASDGVSMQVILEVLIGAAVALWGGVGEFKPIRIGDGKKPRWESLHQRPDFQSYNTRAKQLRPLLQSRLPPVPKDAD